MLASEIKDELEPRLSGEIGNRRILRPTSIQIERELEVLGQVMDNQFRIPVLDWRFVGLLA